MGIDQQLQSTIVRRRKEQYAFLQAVYLSNTIRDCLNRGESVYQDGATEAQKQALRETLKFELRRIVERYRSSDVRDEDHIHNIRQLADRLTNMYADILKKGRFRLGRAQKALNVYLKYRCCDDPEIR